MKILITGISGTLARGVAYRLVRRGHEVIGIDRRPWPDVPEGVEMHQADIRKRPAEDVFRVSRPDALVHMATVTHFTTTTEERYRINLGGTRKLFEYCHEYGVKQAVFVGRHTVYGATPDSPLYHTEDEPPLAGAAFKELADLVAADLYAGSALWRWPELNTAVLRLCYFLGPSRGGTLAGFLSKSRVPLVLGFDPLYQLMHGSAASSTSPARRRFRFPPCARLPASARSRSPNRSTRQPSAVSASPTSQPMQSHT
jgi:UDP-glucose 4-epimerase